MVEVQKDPLEMSGETEKIKQGGDVQLTAIDTATVVEPIHRQSDSPIDRPQLPVGDEEVEYSEQEYQNLVKLYVDTLTDFAEGELVVGKVLAVSDKEVAVDIGFKSEGTIPIDEFTNPEEIKVGDDIEVFLDNVEDKEGQLVLSKKKADFMRVWEKINESYERGEIIQGRCLRRIKGGIVVDLMGVDAFLPGSQIDVKPIRDFDACIGQTMDFKVVKVNHLRKNIVVSHRALVEESMAEQRQKILAGLERGQVLPGTVKNITDFGVFIDLGGVDGLLHINDLSWGRVNHPSEVLSLDETVNVLVLDFNEAKDRISLGLKQLQPHPWEKAKEKYAMGSVVRGKVVNISDYGAFVELEKGIEGLIHISEMSWTQHIKHPSKVVNVGEMVEAKILNIDEEQRKISLGLKQLEPDPWESLEVKYPSGTVVQGTVRNLTNFGAFVELEENIDGLVHISDLSWTKKIRHPGEVLKKGDVVQVVVLKVDCDHRRISLGYKQTQENPWDKFEEAFKMGTVTTGKIVRLIEKGVIVELPLEVDGFVPLSHLDKHAILKPADAYKEGDVLDLCVIEFSKDNKRIVLSEKRAHEIAAKAEMEKRKAEAEAAQAAPITEAPAEAVAPPESVPVAPAAGEAVEVPVAELGPEVSATAIRIPPIEVPPEEVKAAEITEAPSPEVMQELEAVEVQPATPEAAAGIEEVTEAPSPEVMQELEAVEVQPATPEAAAGIEEVAGEKPPTEVEAEKPADEEKPKRKRRTKKAAEVAPEAEKPETEESQS